MAKLKKLLPNIIVGLVLVFGVGLLAYPSISDYINELHQTRAIGSYVEKNKDISKEEKSKLLQEAKEYNESLVKKLNRYYLNEEDRKKYNSILDITNTGVMAHMEIPKLNVYMPIYHGTDEAVLQIAIGHIAGSSFPVGGQSTHSLISGHRGLPSAKLFTDLDQLKKGDMFFIYVFDEILAYKVDKIDTVLPDEVDTLEIEEGRDYVTLITCTPYGVNSHRLLVRGERTNYSESKSKVEDVIRDNENKKITYFIIILVILLLLIVGYVIKRRRYLIEK